MNPLILALLVIIIVIGIILFRALARGRFDPDRYPYQLSPYLLSKAERSFYGVLVQVIGDTGIVFSKVRVADVINPKKGLGRSRWQRAFNAISAKHFDFLVCNPKDCSIILAVELDDASHDSSKSQNRDGFLNSACQAAGLPLLRVKAAKAYVMSDLQRQIAEVMPSPQSPQIAQDPFVVLGEAQMDTSPAYEATSRNPDETAMVYLKVLRMTLQRPQRKLHLQYRCAQSVEALWCFARLRPGVTWVRHSGVAVHTQSAAISSRWPSSSELYSLIGLAGFFTVHAEYS